MRFACKPSDRPGPSFLPLRFLPVSLRYTDINSSDLQLYVSFLVLWQQDGLSLFPKGYDNIVHTKEPGPNV